MTSFAYRISPSDLSGLWSECRACFARKVRDGVPRPGSPSPIYSVADRAMKDAFGVGKWVDLGVGPQFRVVDVDLLARSAAVVFRDLDVSLVVAGRCDMLVQTRDGELFVVDNKATCGDDDSLRRYRPQLAAYAFALENPDRGDALSLDGHALLACRPISYAFKSSGSSGLYGRTSWVEIPKRDQLFVQLLREVAVALARGGHPSSQTCAFCSYRLSGAAGSHKQATSVLLASPVI